MCLLCLMDLEFNNWNISNFFQLFMIGHGTTNADIIQHWGLDLLITTTRGKLTQTNVDVMLSYQGDTSLFFVQGDGQRNHQNTYTCSFLLFLKKPITSQLGQSICGWKSTQSEFHIVEHQTKEERWLKRLEHGMVTGARHLNFRNF